MTLKSRIAAAFFFVTASGWIGWQSYRCFLDPSMPKLMLSGIVEDGYYSGDVSCSLGSTKAGDVLITLDDKVLTEPERVSLGISNRPYQFTVHTESMNEGKHVLCAEFTDKTFKKNTCSLCVAFTVDNTPLRAAFAKTDDFKVFQGRTLHVQFQTNKEIAHAKVKALSHEYDCFPESKGARVYECFIPIACEESPNEYLFSAEIIDYIGNSVMLDNKFQIVMYPFKKQNLVLDKDKVLREKELGISMTEREKVFEDLAHKSLREKMWRGAFCTPIDIARITCEFGTIRTTQEKGRYMHKALDVVNEPRSVVWAPQSGVVVLKDRYEDSGNTIVIDHGWGLLSMFYHLDDFADIAVGQKVAQGNPLGLLGKTGYAKGYHLHWEMRLNNVAVDPMQWTKLAF